MNHNLHIRYFSVLIFCRENDLIRLHILHFGEELWLNYSVGVSGAENHIVGGAKEPAVFLIPEMTPS